MNPQVELMNKARAERGITGGRPLKYATPQDFEKDANAYFAKTPQSEWTITALAIALNTSRATLMNLEARPEFFDAVKSAKDKIEMAYELDLRQKGNAGSIFGLKNFGWKDERSIDQTSSDGSMSPKADLNVVIADKFADLLQAEAIEIESTEQVDLPEQSQK